jgi:SAM-dependent methyltransferase
MASPLLIWLKRIARVMVPQKDKNVLTAAMGHLSIFGRTAITDVPASHIRFELSELLDHTYEFLVQSSVQKVDDVLDPLLEVLATVRQVSDEGAWRETIGQIRRHPLFPLLLHDPLTYQCFHKPRGHAPDPVMLDLVYGDEIEPQQTSDLAKRLLSYMVRRPFAQALRDRRDSLAALMDAIAEQTGGTAEMLAIEAGHMREARRSHAFQFRSLRRFVALERDVQAIDLVERELGHSLVTAIHTPTYAMLNGGRAALGYFDLIYSVGLFERLEDAAAAQALATVFATLKPGGKVWLSNFSPGLREAAYLESFMNWWPTYRDGPALERMAAAIPSSEIMSVKTELDPTGSIVSLELTHC